MTGYQMLFVINSGNPTGVLNTCNSQPEFTLAYPGIYQSPTFGFSQVNITTDAVFNSALPFYLFFSCPVSCQPPFFLGMAARQIKDSSINKLRQKQRQWFRDLCKIDMLVATALLIQWRVKLWEQRPNLLDEILRSHSTTIELAKTDIHTPANISPILTDCAKFPWLWEFIAV